MRKYAILGSLLILGMALAGRAVSLAQQNAKEWSANQSPVLAIPTVSEGFKEKSEQRRETVALVTLPNVPIVDEPIKAAAQPLVGLPSPPGETSQPAMPPEPAPAGDAQFGLPPAPPDQGTLPAFASNTAPTPQPSPAQAMPPSSLAPSPGDDPMGAVETFLDRNRKEAENSIQTLNQEAEALRTRLQKVEAALARWQDVSKALKAEGTTPQSQPTATQLEPIPASAEQPAMKPEPTAPPTPGKWSKPSAEGVPPATKPPELLPKENLPPELPSAIPADVKPNDPLPIPAESKPTEKKPEPTTELPALPEPAAPTLPPVDNGGPKLPENPKVTPTP
jgi:hypothetical protein